MRTGKDYLCNVLKNMLPLDLRTTHLALADHFKIDAITKDKLSYDKVYGKKDEKTRDILQKRGTEEGRNKYGKDIWINTLDTWMKIHAERGVECIFITDVRFPNELEYFKENYKQCVSIRINAPKRNMEGLKQEGNPELQYHISETALDDSGNQFDYRIDNDPSDSQTAFGIIRIIALAHVIRYKKIAFVDLDDTISQCSIYYKEIAKKVGEKVMNHLENNSNYKSVLGGYDKSYDFLSMFLKFYKKVTEDFESLCFSRNNFSEYLKKTTKMTFDYFGDEDNGYLANYAYTEGQKVYQSEFKEIDGSIKAINKLTKFVDKVVIFTVGERSDQLYKLYKLGIANDFTCETFIHKDATLFEILKHKYPAKEYIMIGDSYVRDVLPAIKANIDNIYHVNNELTNFTIEKQVNVVSTLECAVNLIYNQHLSKSFVLKHNF